MSEALENNMKGISAICFTGQQFRLSTDQLEEVFCMLGKKMKLTCRKLQKHYIDIPIFDIGHHSTWQAYFTIQHSQKPKHTPNTFLYT